MQPPVVIVTFTQTNPPPTKLNVEEITLLASEWVAANCPRQAAHSPLPGSSVVLIVALKLVENDGVGRVGVGGGRQNHLLVQFA